MLRETRRQQEPRDFSCCARGVSASGFWYGSNYIRVGVGVGIVCRPLCSSISFDSFHRRQHCSIKISSMYFDPIVPMCGSRFHKGPGLTEMISGRRGQSDSCRGDTNHELQSRLSIFRVPELFAL
jgi:hypothetical protein